MKEVSDTQRPSLLASRPAPAVVVRPLGGTPARDTRSVHAVLVAARKTSPFFTTVLLVVADLLTLSAAFAVTLWGKYWLMGPFRIDLYWRLWPLMAMFVIVYAAVGLYSGVALYPAVSLAPAEELRRFSMATTWVYLALGVTTFLLQGGKIYSRSAFLATWVVSLIMVPLGRALVRKLFARRGWWGHPVVVLGAGRTGQMVIETLLRQPGLGMKPVAVLDDDPEKHGDLSGVPVLGMDQVSALVHEWTIPYAIIAMPGVSGERRLDLFYRYGHLFPHMLIIPDLVGFSSLWVVAKDLGGILGLELRQNLLLRGPQLAKRAFDIVASVCGGLLLLPLVGLIALLIKLESRGPAFYGQKRIGKAGRKFKAWKFRTMVVNGDRVLARYFDRHPELLDEWMTTQKLKHDPRVTRVGRLLRTTSLDELPQIWNILRGEMSLVGPRPIVAEEIPRYGDKFNLYCKVLPGLTGLWQVSGRNNTTYEERVDLDSYYVNNWSVWLDIYISVRTVHAVLSRQGAY